MAAVCKHCNECAYDSEEQVCKSCGVVTEEIQFGSEFIPHRSATPKSQWPKAPPAGLKFGMNILDTLSHKYSISSDVKAETLDLLKATYSKKSFRRKQDVGVMAGCCLVHVQRKHGQFVSLSDLCSKLKCTKKQAFKFLKVLKLNDVSEEKHVPEANALHVPQEEENIEDFPEKLKSVIQALLSSAPQENKSDLIDKTTALTKLANACWLVSGRSPEGVISAAAYLCWKSMHPFYRSLTFKQFCVDFALNYNKARARIPELKEMLLKLGRNIPSMSTNYVTEKNVLFHLDYILKNSETLRNDLLPDEFTVEEIDKKEFSAFRIVRPRFDKNCGPNSEPSTCYDPDMHASDIEISDTEIASYIRSEEQIKLITALKAKNTSPSTASNHDDGNEESDIDEDNE